MRIRLVVLIVTNLLLFATAAHSHHSFAAVYDGTRQTTVSGIVTQFRFVNPHAMMYLNATDAAGKTVKWVVEFDGNLNLSTVGWTADTIKSGAIP